MKSIFLTILIFIAVFILAGSGFFSVIGENWFHYTSYAAFALVMLCGVFVTLFHKPSKSNNSEINKQKENKDAEK